MPLKNLDLSVDFRPGGRPFVLHYDGFSVAHIELFERHGSEIGLCVQNSSPHRQVISPLQPTQTSDFSSVFNSHLDKACKLEEPRFSKRTAKEKPWITCGLITSINRKHELYDLWKTAGKVKCLCESGTDGRCQPCIETLRRREEFRDHRRLLNHLINCAKRKYHGEKIQECSGDSKKTWQIINELRGKKRRQIKPNFIIDNERVKNRRIIANEFNKYFASIASNLNEVYSGDQVRISSLPSFTDYLPKSESSSIYLRECDYDEIMKIINEMTNGKSSDIPIHVIKKASQIISPNYLTIQRMLAGRLLP